MDVNVEIKLLCKLKKKRLNMTEKLFTGTLNKKIFFFFFGGGMGAWVRGGGRVGGVLGGSGWMGTEK